MTEHLACPERRLCSSSVLYEIVSLSDSGPGVILGFVSNDRPRAIKDL